MSNDLLKLKKNLEHVDKSRLSYQTNYVPVRTANSAVNKKGKVAAAAKKMEDGQKANDVKEWEEFKENFFSDAWLVSLMWPMFAVGALGSLGSVLYWVLAIAALINPPIVLGSYIIVWLVGIPVAFLLFMPINYIYFLVNGYRIKP